MQLAPLRHHLRVQNSTPARLYHLSNPSFGLRSATQHRHDQHMLYDACMTLSAAILQTSPPGMNAGLNIDTFM